MRNKEKFYEDATHKLLKKIDSMGLEQLHRMQAKNLVLLFRDSFKLPDVKQATFEPGIKTDISRFTYDSDGFCKSSGYAYCSKMNEFLNNQGNPNEWVLMYISDLWPFGPHHYVLHKPSKTVFDITYDQYDHIGIEIPYYMGSPVVPNESEYQSAFRFANSLGISLITKSKNRKINNVIKTRTIRSI